MHYIAILVAISSSISKTHAANVVSVLQPIVRKRMRLFEAIESVIAARRIVTPRTGRQAFPSSVSDRQSALMEAVERTTSPSTTAPISLRLTSCSSTCFFVVESKTSWTDQITGHPSFWQRAPYSSGAPSTPRPQNYSPPFL